MNKTMSQKPFFKTLPLFADTADGTRCFLVTSKTGYNELEEDHLFVTVDDEYILEANSSGKVRWRGWHCDKIFASVHKVMGSPKQ